MKSLSKLIRTMRNIYQKKKIIFKITHYTPLKSMSSLEPETFGSADRRRLLKLTIGGYAYFLCAPTSPPHSRVLKTRTTC